MVHLDRGSYKRKIWISISGLNGLNIVQNARLFSVDEIYGWTLALLIVDLK